MNYTYREFRSNGAASKVAAQKDSAPRKRKLCLALAMGLAVHGQIFATDYTLPVEASGGDSLSLSGDTVSVTLDNATGLGAWDVGTRLNADNVTVSMSGTNAAAIYADLGATLMFGNGSIGTQGQNGAGAMALGANTHMGLSNTSITTQGNAADGLAVGGGGQIAADGLTITTNGSSAYGAYMGNGSGKLQLSNSTVGTMGDYSVGMGVSGAGSQLIAEHVSITTQGQEANGLTGFGGSTLELSDVSIETRNDHSHGLTAFTAGTTVTGTDVDIATHGTRADGVFANTGSVITLNNGSITTDGYGSIGLSASGAGSAITVNGTRIETQQAGDIVMPFDGSSVVDGLSSFGANAESKAAITLTNGASITTHGYQAYGLRALGADSTITADDATVLAAGVNSAGAVAIQSGAIAMRNGAVTTTGSGSVGLAAFNVGSTVSASGTHIKTQGEESGGVGGHSAYGVDAEQGGIVTLLSGTVVSTQGSTAHAIRVSGAGSQVSTGDVTVSAVGDSAYGAVVVNGGTLTLGQNTSIQTSGKSAHGVVGLGQDSVITATGMSVKTQGADTAAVLLVNGNASLTDSTLTGQRSGIGLSASDLATPVANTVNISGGKVNSVQGPAILADAGTNVINLSNGAQVVGGNGVLLSVISPTTKAALSADGNVVVTGDVQSTFSNQVAVSLANGSELTGATRNVAGMTIDSSSVWNITGNSNVASLSLGGTASFASPATGGYKSLTVHGDLTGNGGTVAINTTLNGGGALLNQLTDRVFVEGNASGTTYLKVMGTGQGAATDSNSNGVMESSEGISLAQVAGTSSATAFALAGGYVAVGPWRYDLVAYHPGDASAAQRQVAGSGSGFWDYRLQSASVPDPSPAPDPTPTPKPDPTPAPTPNSDPIPAADPSDDRPAAPVRPGVVPQVPAYLSASTAMLSYGMRSLGTLHDRLGELHQGETTQAGDTDEFYARTFGGNYQYHTDRSFSQYGYDFNQNDRGIQIGGTWLKTGGDASSFRLGMYAGTGTSHVTPKAIDGTSAMRMSGSSLAATGTFMTGNGFYLDGVVARNYYSTRVDTAYRGHDMANMKTHGWTYSLESGYPFVFGSDVRLEPQAQVVYQSLRTNSFHDADGLTVTPENTGAWQGRVGANLGKTFVTASGQRWTPWMRVNYLWSSSSRSTVDVSSDEWGVSSALATGSWGQAWQVGAGVTGALTPTLSVYGSGDYQGNVDSAGEQGWSANLGLRWQF